MLCTRITCWRRVARCWTMVGAQPYVRSLICGWLFNHINSGPRTTACSSPWRKQTTASWDELEEVSPWVLSVRTTHTVLVYCCFLSNLPKQPDSFAPRLTEPYPDDRKTWCQHHRRVRLPPRGTQSWRWTSWCMEQHVWVGRVVVELDLFGVTAGQFD